MKPKVVKVGAKSFPKLLDRPGKDNDVIVLTKLAGADWFVGAATDAVKFDGTAKTASVPVSAATTVKVQAAASTLTNSFQINGPSEFAFSPTDSSVTYTDAQLTQLLTFIDMPGTKGDSVTLTKVNGVHWKIGEVVYDEAKFGTKSTLVVKLGAGAKVYPVSVGATLSGSAATNGISGTTDSLTITYSAVNLAAAAVVGDNPFDATKGVGKGASIETVKITGLPGIQWKVGSSPKAVSVKPGAVLYVPVPAADLDGLATEVPVTPIAATNFIVPTSGTPAAPTPVQVQFKDADRAKELIVGPRQVETDRSGTVNDTLVLPTQRGMSWFAGQKDAKGKLTYKQLKAGKDGTAVYKVKHGKDGKDVVVYYRAVADRGYLVNDAAVQTAPFGATEKPVPAPTFTAGAVTLKPADGIASWDVVKTVNGKVAKTSYKPSDITAAGADSITVPADAAPDFKVIKGYKKG